jgi:hypothetical protein
MADYFGVPTDLGIAKIAAAMAAGTLVTLTHFAVGDGALDPVASQTALQNEVYRAPVNNLRVVPAATHILEAECNIPPEISGFTVREIGLFDIDGDLIAVSNYQATPKLDVASGASLDLLIKPQLIFANSNILQAVIDPTIVMATRQLVDDTNDLTLLIVASSLVSNMRASLADWWVKRLAALEAAKPKEEIIVVNQIINSNRYVKDAYHPVLLSNSFSLSANDVTATNLYLVPFIPQADMTADSVAFATQSVTLPDPGQIFAGVYNRDGVLLAGNGAVYDVTKKVNAMPILPLSMKAKQIYYIAFWEAAAGVVGRFVAENTIIPPAEALPSAATDNQFAIGSQIVLTKPQPGLAALPGNVDFNTFTQTTACPYLAVRNIE